jgi:hypothetical protein
MALPVDTTKLTILCGGLPGPVLDRETGQQRKNAKGEALFRTDVVVMGVGRPQVLSVRTTSEPKGLATGAPVSVPELSVTTFTARDGGTGVLFEASVVEPAKAARVGP